MGRHTGTCEKNTVSILLSALSGKDGPWGALVGMTRSKRKSVLRAMAAIALCLLNIASAAGQAAPAKQLMSEQAFKNVTVLKGIPVDEFMDTMGFISASTNYNCIDCHVEPKVEGDWSVFAEALP